jgi:hypothetical protein
MCPGCGGAPSLIAAAPGGRAYCSGVAPPKGGPCRRPNPAFGRCSALPNGFHEYRVTRIHAHRVLSAIGNRDGGPAGGPFGGVIQACWGGGAGEGGIRSAWGQAFLFPHSHSAFTRGGVLLAAAKPEGAAPAPARPCWKTARDTGRPYKKAPRRLRARAPGPESPRPLPRRRLQLSSNGARAGAPLGGGRLGAGGLSLLSAASRACKRPLAPLSVAVAAARCWCCVGHAYRRRGRTCDAPPGWDADHDACMCNSH